MYLCILSCLWGVLFVIIYVQLSPVSNVFTRVCQSVILSVHGSWVEAYDYSLVLFKLVPLDLITSNVQVHLQ